MSGFFSGAADPFWPHVLLLAFAIVASFSVAIGIVLESPRWSVANALVIGGVAMEAVCTLLLFGFDEGISSAQQSKIIALESRFAPRPISPGEIADFMGALTSFKGTEFDLAIVTEQNPEIRSVAVSLEKTLAASKWVQVPCRCHIGIMNLSAFVGNSIDIGFDTAPNGERAPFAGIAVHGDADASRKPADALSAAFEKSGRTVADAPWGAIKAWMPNDNTNAVHILVGAKL
jgi:hypothetical protein